MSILAHHLCHPLVCLSPLLGDLPLKLGQHLLPQARLHLPQVIHPKPFPGFRQDPLRVDPRRGLPSQSRADVLGRGGAVGGGLAGSRLCGGGGGSCPSLCTGWDRGLRPLLPLPLKGCGGGGLSTGHLGGGGRGGGQPPLARLSGQLLGGQLLLSSLPLCGLPGCPSHPFARIPLVPHQLIIRGPLLLRHLLSLGPLWGHPWLPLGQLSQEERQLLCWHHHHRGGSGAGGGSREPCS